MIDPQALADKIPVKDELNLVEFFRELRMEGLAEGTIINYVQALKHLAKHLNKSLVLAKKEDLKEWVLTLDELAEGTASNYQIMIKRFYRWIEDGELNGNGYPEKVDFMNPRRKHGRYPPKILTRGEIKRMLEATDSQRDRAMLFVGYESGCRAGELLGLKIKDVEFDQYGAVIRVNGKTGERRLRLIESVKDLKLWLSMHPEKGNPEAPVWWSRNSGALCYFSWYRNLKKIGGKARIKKKISTHTLRHSRATHLAGGILTEAQMREYFGWTKSSNMPEIYVHLSGRDVDHTLFKHYGVKVEPEDGKELLSPITCPYCGTDNTPTARFCEKCNTPLDSVSVREVKEKDRARERLVERVIHRIIERNPELVEEILREEQTHKELTRLAKSTA